MQIKVAWQDNVHFLANNEQGHTVAMDGPEEAGGQNQGARPLELMLMGLGGCTAFDVVDILRKGRQQITDLTVDIRAQRADEIPAVFENIDLHFVVTGLAIDEARVRRAIDLTAEKYCSASIMLERAGVKIAHTFEILEDEFG